MIGFVTHAALPHYAPGDDLAAAALERRGLEVRPVPWNAPDVDWLAFEALVLRSCWNYHREPGRFHDWLGARERDGVAIWNAPSIVRWNAHKRYLLELAAAGIAVAPTEILGGEGAPALAEVLARRGWDRAVVKPAVGADGEGARLTSLATAPDDAAWFAPLARERELLVQPFLEEIARDGEWSLVFLAGEFSHAVRKRPGTGDFRVQHRYGGASVAMDPPAALVRDAGAVLRAAGVDPLYARVDGCARDGGLVLMELELIEPSLFLDLAPPAAADRFAQAIAAAVPA